MNDQEIIAWARANADAADEEGNSGAAARIRRLAEMAGKFCPVDVVNPAPRRPLPGWKRSNFMGWSAALLLRAEPLIARASRSGWTIYLYSDGDVSGHVVSQQAVRGIEAAQLAAEDALFGIADTILALRGSP